MKAYTDIDQSKRLAEILPLESADMEYMFLKRDGSIVSRVPFIKDGYEEPDCSYNMVSCWSLTALLKYLSEIKPKVYTPVLFPSEGKWILQFAEYGHGNVYEVSYDNPIDACVALIKNLHELKLL
jgi:hypothetical protein